MNHVIKCVVAKQLAHLTIKTLIATIKKNSMLSADYFTMSLVQFTLTILVETLIHHSMNIDLTTKYFQE